jgi:hypothetical protein
MAPDPHLHDDAATARSAALPPPAGPGLMPGNVEQTAAQSDPGAIGGGTAPRPERYLLVVRRADAGAGADDARYLFARWPDWPHPALLSLSPPAAEEGVATAVGAVLEARMGVATTTAPRVSALRVPARMRHPRTGVEGLGWLRAVAVDVAGEPRPDALLEGVVTLTADEAAEALPTAVERIVFAAGASA